MTLYTIFQVTIVCFMGAMSPGPSVAVIIHNTITKNRFNGIITSIGHGLGIFIYALLAVLGLDLVIKNYYEFFIGFQILGSCLLILIGLNTIISAKKEKNLKIKNEKLISKNSFFQGFFIAFLNPKILVFFTALFSQFININANILDKTILILIPGIIDTLWYIFVSIVVSLYAINNFIYGNKIIIERITGSLLIIIAFTLLFNLN